MEEVNLNQLKAELEKLLENLKTNLKDVKRFALGEAWKVLQLVTAHLVQKIQEIGTDLSGPDKKALVLSCVDEFYDRVFLVIDIPFLPKILESLLHKYVKAILMVLVGASIDALVTTFKNVGVFAPKTT